MNRSAEDKPIAMTFRQALLFVMYYAIGQAIIVVLVGLVLSHLAGAGITWKGLLLAFALLASCGPVFAVLIYWSRASRSRLWPFMIRSGLSMCTMAILYVSAVTLGSRRLGLSFISPAALPGYFAAVIVFGLPISLLTAYFVWRWRIDPERRQSS